MEPYTVTMVTKIRAENNSYPVFINISGLLYETRKKTLKKFPNTLLGNHRKLSAYFCPYRNEYYFDRHRESFTSILFFYQSSGKLYRPENINLKVFLDECSFFELPKWAIDAMKRKEGGFLEDEIIDFLNPSIKEALTLREKMCQFFEEPLSTSCSRFFAYFAITLLMISILINSLKTIEHLRPVMSEAHLHDGWEIIDIIINTYFLIEFVFRFAVSPSKIEFFKSVLVWIDLIALVSFIPLLNKHYTHHSVVLFFTPFELFRVVRIIRLAKLYPEYNFTEIIVKDCLGYMKIFLTWLVFVAMLAATVTYVIEEHENETRFHSVPESFYWGIQTFVTLGYGDLVPQTYLGKLFASMFILAFVPTLCLPTLTVLVRFAKYYEFAKFLTDDTDTDTHLPVIRRNRFGRQSTGFVL